MRILLYGINYAPELTGIGKYSGELAEWLVSRGHEVQVVTAPPYYPDWRVHGGFSQVRYSSETGAGVQVTRCPLYVPKELSFAKRIMHLISFALSSAPVVLSKYAWKPDLVICVAPSLFCAPAAILLAAMRGCMSVVHVQDFEVDAMLGLRLSSDRFLARAARRYERFALTRARRVSTISSSMIKRAVAKGVAPEKLILFPNWSEVSRFLRVDAKVISALRSKLDLPAGRKICLYSGNIGDKQGLEDIVDVAGAFQSESVEFVFVGQGAGLERLQTMAVQAKINNLRFLPLQAYEDLPALLALADCHLVIQKAGVADAVMPSKVTNIFAVGGQALITAEADTELGRLCKDYPGIAVRVEPENVQAIEAGIREVLSQSASNDIAQSYAKRHLDKEAVLTEFESEMLRSLNG